MTRARHCHARVMPITITAEGYTCLMRAGDISGWPCATCAAAPDSLMRADAPAIRADASRAAAKLWQ